MLILASLSSLDNIDVEYSNRYFSFLMKNLFFIQYDNTLLSFVGIDAVMLGRLTHISVIPWLFMYMTSHIFRYCYVHRLPLYYIAANELLVDTDYYIGIPVDDIKLLLIHLTIIILLIFGYSYYYIKCKLKWEDL